MTELMWLALGLLVGSVAGLVIGSYFGRASTLDEIEQRWWRYLREQRKAGLN